MTQKADEILAELLRRFDAAIEVAEGVRAKMRPRLGSRQLEYYDLLITNLKKFKQSAANGRFGCALIGSTKPGGFGMGMWLGEWCHDEAVLKVCYQVEDYFRNEFYESIVEQNPALPSPAIPSGAADDAEVDAMAAGLDGRAKELVARIDRAITLATSKRDYLPEDTAVWIYENYTTLIGDLAEGRRRVIEGQEPHVSRGEHNAGTAMGTGTWLGEWCEDDDVLRACAAVENYIRYEY